MRRRMRLSDAGCRDSWSAVLEYSFGCAIDCSHECFGAGVSAGLGRRRSGAWRTRERGAADAAGPRRVGGFLSGVAGGIGGGVRSAGRVGAVAGGAAEDVRPGGGGPPAALLLRRGRAAARSGGDRPPRGAGGGLWG